MNYKRKLILVTIHYNRLKEYYDVLSKQYKEMMVLKDQRYEALEKHKDTMLSIQERSYDSLQGHCDYWYKEYKTYSDKYWKTEYKYMFVSFILFVSVIINITLIITR